VVLDRARRDRQEVVGQLREGPPLLPSAGAVTFVDIDSLPRRVYGKQKQGASFGHAKVGGYQVLLRGLNPSSPRSASRTQHR
jgi:hypothetical protein